MARVRSVSPGTQNIGPHKSDVDCFHQVVTTPDGVRLLHLTTFGSEERESGPKSSQSLQLDADVAAQLVGVIRATFPGL